MDTSSTSLEVKRVVICIKNIEYFSPLINFYKHFD